MQDYYFSHTSTYTAISGADTPIYLRPEQITVPQNRQNPSKSLNSIIRLAESIKKYGILEPLTVKTLPQAAGVAAYELISGARRLRAAISAGITQIPCILLSDDPKSGAVSAILASLQAGGLHIFEQAAAFRLLMDDFGLSQKEIARKTGISQSAVANKLRLLQLSREEQQQILTSKLSERHARALLRLKEKEARVHALNKIVEESMTVSAAEKMIDELCAAPPKEPENAPFSVVLAPETPPAGILPRKFAIPSLVPLYNSIERTLSIFRKTGATATCQREEGPSGVRIVIEIPKNG